MSICMVQKTQGMLNPRQQRIDCPESCPELQYKGLFSHNPEKGARTVARNLHALMPRTSSLTLKRNSLKIVQVVELAEVTGSVCIERTHTETVKMPMPRT